MNNPTDSTKPGAAEANDSCSRCDHTLAFLLLRGWLGVRAILTGIEKLAGFRTVQKPFVDPVTGAEDPSGALIEIKQKFYSITNYSAAPPALREKLAQEPLLPGFATSAFFGLLGWALIALGLMLLIGLGTRLSLFLQGLVYIALTVGLILIRQDDGVAWLGIHVALVAFALTLARHNRYFVCKKW